MTWSTDMGAIAAGDAVISADGHRIGTVADVHRGYIVVEKGLVFATDHFIPSSAIVSAGDGQVVLNVSRDVTLESGWDVEPLTLNGEIGSGATNVDDGVCLEVDSVDRPARVEAMAVGDEIRIPVFAEELTATVRPVETGAVRIRKRIVSEDRVIEVPVTEEEIRVERRIVDRPIGGATEAVEQIIIEVPLRKETVDVEKRAHATEEIVVTKDVIQRTERVTDTVRREEVRIDEGDGVIG
jgi:uncharacterized protein (TIGR02271 family)